MNIWRIIVGVLAVIGVCTLLYALWLGYLIFKDWRLLLERRGSEDKILICKELKRKD